MSISHLLESKTITTGFLPQCVPSEDADKSNRSDISINSVTDPAAQTKITYNVSPCFSAFDVALVGRVGSEIVDCVQLRNVLPHSSYTICNIVMEQPIVTFSDKTFVYNADSVTDALAAGTETKHSIKKEKIKAVKSGSNDAVVADCKKSKTTDTSSQHLASNSEDPKSFRQSEQPLTICPPHASKSSGDTMQVCSSLDQGRPEKQAVLERRFKCEHKGCEKSFAYQTHLCFHIQHAHMNHCPYMCNFEGCGRSFYTEDHLVVHLRGHTEVKPFVCPYEKCKKAFSTTGNLRNHVRTHTGEKPYKCSHKGCNKGFAELSSVKKHELTHTGEKPYPCRICSRCFSQAGSRNTHERHRHKDVFASCDKT